MVNYTKFVLGFLLVSAVSASLLDMLQSEPPVVDSVDLTKYAGQWYQVFDIPRPFDVS